MERIAKVRVIVAFKDITKNGEYQDTQKILFLDYKRTRELEKRGLIKIMEIRRSFNE